MSIADFIQAYKGTPKLKFTFEHSNPKISFRTKDGIVVTGLIDSDGTGYATYTHRAEGSEWVYTGEVENGLGHGQGEDTRTDGY